MSLDNIMNDDRKNQAEEVIDIRTERPGDEEIRENWQKCADIYADKSRMANAIKTSKLEIDANDIEVNVTFLVSNDAQVAWIRSNALSKLEGELQRLLRWPSVKLSVDRLQDGVQVREAYTPEEKWALMKEANPEVANLVSDMDATLR